MLFETESWNSLWDSEFNQLLFKIFSLRVPLKIRSINPLLIKNVSLRLKLDTPIWYSTYQSNNHLRIFLWPSILRLYFEILSINQRLFKNFSLRLHLEILSINPLILKIFSLTLHVETPPWDSECQSIIAKMFFYEIQSCDKIVTTSWYF